ncbi:MAG TPA: HEAT repeat domain-containing protein [Polyangia bacterium]|nr:HEAT repeat domain-containing protein [Polyangia bacterium]
MAAGDAKSVTKKLAALLASDAAERQIAAAIVVGELGLRDPALVSGLVALLEGGMPPLQRHAAEALARLAPPKALPHLVPLLGSRDEGVRRAAAAAVGAFGDAALPALRARLAATDGDERRAVEEALARVGGTAAISTLLGGLDVGDVEEARAATLAARQRIKDADARERRAYLTEVKHFLGLAKTKASVAATVAALRVLGFLEDGSVVPLLVAHATGGKRAPEVREEALIALRFLGRTNGARKPDAAATKAATAVALELAVVAETAPLPTARAAMYTLACLPLPAALAPRLAKLAAHPEPERARLATERLAQMPGPDASRALGRVLLATKERALAEAAATALAARPDAGVVLARALLDAPDADRAVLLARLLRPHLAAVDAKTTRAVRDAALARLAADAPAWEPLLQVAREADPKATAAALRDAGEKLRKGKPTRALVALRALGRGAEATPDDGYAWATLELAQGRRDEALTIFGQLTERGFDLAAALRRDRALDAEARYQIGFHFAERRHPVGEEILTAVAEAAGRTKVGQMARAKLRSAGYGDQ